MDVIERLHSKGLIKPPGFVVGGTQYLCLMGSVAYGVSTENSDEDIYGWCIPARDIVFPHLRGEIPGFGTQIQRFDQYQQHHIFEQDRQKEYDLNIYNIIKYFSLTMAGNPNMIDSLFVPQNCIIKSTKVADHVRDSRKLFLSKKCWHTFKGYAYQQMHKMRIKNPEIDSTRYETTQKFGYDTKYAYHLVRLLNQVQQLLEEGDLDLQRNREQLKSIRRGEWPVEQVESYFMDKEKNLEEVYVNSKLPHKPREEEIKKLLLECLEEYYGSLDGMIESSDHYKSILREIHKLTEKI